MSEPARTVFDRPLVVEAGAGTGKTTTLIARMLTWCLGPGWADATEREPERIAAQVLDAVVAITFTEAAAAEMAERFGRALLDLAQGTAVIGYPLPTPQDQERARYLLAAVDRLVISTIHSFCHRILASSPLQAGVHPAFEVDADGTAVAEVVHDVVVQWFTEVFTGHDPVREPLMVLADHGVGSEEIVEALTRLITYGLPVQELEREVFTPAAVGRLLARTDTALRTLLDLISPALWMVALRVPVTEALAATLGGLLRLASAGDLSPVLKAIEGVEPNQLKRLSDWSRGRFKANERRLFHRKLDAIAVAAGDARRILRTLGRLQPQVLDAGRQVMVPLLRRAEQALASRGSVTFTQLLRDARDLLASDARVRQRYRGRYRQLLVDEFQDTDRIQCDLVRLLALGDEPGPGLFVVGDPKQSIYGWRSADLTAYDDFKQEVLDAGGDVLFLATNRRSLAPILDEVEQVVQPHMIRELGYQPDFQSLDCARAGEPGVPVEYWVSWDWDGQQPVRLRADATARLEGRMLAQDLLRRHRDEGLAWDDVGVLFRSQTSLEIYLTELRAAGIPYVVERDRNYFRKREIIDASALVRCVLEPSDHLALLTTLRSPLVGVPDAALLPLWRSQFPRCMTELQSGDVSALRPIVDAIAAQVDALDVPRIGHVAGWHHILLDVAAGIGQLRAEREALPVDVFVERLRELLPSEVLASARFLGEYRLANLERFFRELVLALEAGEGDAQGVLRALRTAVAGAREAEEARPIDADEKAVRMMTVHKSKGLDFRHTYVCQLHKARAEDYRPDNLGAATSTRQHDGGWDYTLFDARTPGYDQVEAHDQRVEACERVRLLYVAMTRAKDRLVLIGKWPEEPTPVRPSQARSLMDLLQRPGVPDLAAAMAAGPRLDLGPVSWVFPARIEEHQPPLRGGGRSKPPPTDLAGEAARVGALRDQARDRMDRAASAPASDAAHHALEASLHAAADGTRAPGRPMLGATVGTAVHRALELMDPAGPPEQSLVRAKAALRVALRTVAAPEELDDAVERGDGLLERFVGGALGAHFRSLAGHVVSRELDTLAQPEGERGPVGFMAGAIDLVHGDPQTGELVVVDYKTDFVPTPEALALRVEAYALQGRTYAASLQRGLGLDEPPRVELWFLQADERVVVDASAVPPPAS